ncbi:MAG: hypothetical protein JSV91_03785, partial [Phycisphaerales bacterium]
MNRKSFLQSVVAGIAVAASAQNAPGGWSSDPAQNLAIADRPQAQSYPLMAPTADGGCYIAWFDDAAGGFDVCLQRLDAAGNELWPHNGIRVADRNYTSTEHYGLDVDADGNALLSFREVRGGSDQMVAYKVGPDGEMLWGDDGVQLTTGYTFKTSPKIAATTDGHVVVAW